MSWGAVMDVFMLLCALAMLAGGGGLMAIAVYGVTLRLRAWWRRLRATLKASPYYGRHAAADARGARGWRWWRGDCGPRGRLWDEALLTGGKPYVSLVDGQWRLAVWHPHHGEVLDRDRYVSEAGARAALAGPGRSPRGIVPSELMET